MTFSQCTSTRVGSHLRRIAVAIVAILMLAPTVAVVHASPAGARANPLPEIPEPSWGTNGIVNVILPIGNTIYIGGDFTEVNDGAGTSRNRNHLAAIDRRTGAVTSFNPNMNNRVFGLTPSPDASTLYAVGAFTEVKNVSRKRVAAFDIATGALTDFSVPGPNNSVRGVATNGTLLYIGGFFRAVGGQPRDRLAAYDIATETLDSTWTPATNNSVKSIIADPDKIWIGGNFSKTNNELAKGLSALDPVDGSLLATEHATFPVLDISAYGNQIFAAGAGPGGRAAAFNRTTGAEQWVAKANGNFQAVGAYGDYAYFGGHHTLMAGVEVEQMTRLDIATGELDTSWLPRVVGVRGVNAVATDGVHIYLGGDFSFVSGVRSGGFAMFAHEEPAPPPPPPPPTDTRRPVLVKLTMHDFDRNGRIETVRAQFDEPLTSCSAPCTRGWVLRNVPSGGSLQSVRTKGNVATLTLTEGTRDPNTAVGNFKVELTRPNPIKDDDGNRAEFAPTKPIDRAGPVPIYLRKADAGTAGLAEQGDVFSTTWSEPLLATSLPTEVDVIMASPTDGGPDWITIEGLSDGAIELGADGYVVCPNPGCSGPRPARFEDSAVTLSDGGRIAKVTLATCSGNCGALAAGPVSTVVYHAAPSITDAAGNAAGGSVEKTFRVF